MVLTISSLFSEPGFAFSISHKVDNLIRDKLRTTIMKQYNLDKKEKDIFLGLIISTNSKTKRVEVKGPDFDKRNKFINWGLWLPYEDIVKSDNQLIPYLKYLFDALVLVFENYDVKKDDILKIKEVIEVEVINNSDYEFNEEVTKPLDLSKFNLNI